MESATEGRETALSLEPTRIHSLNPLQAKRTLLQALAKSRPDTGKAYGVIIYDRLPKNPPNVLALAKEFIAAYLRAWGVADRGKASFRDRWQHGKGLVEEDRTYNVRFFVGSADADDVTRRVADSPGIYIVPSRLDPKVLQGMGLPEWPKELRALAPVIQVEAKAAGLEQNLDDQVWRVLVESAAQGQRLDGLNAGAMREREIRHETLAWREAFVHNYPVWTAEQVASEATSTAKNRASVASRWLKERRIFAVKYHGKKQYPAFEFRLGEPVPIVAKVIDVFGEEANGWDIAYFFGTPNPNIGGHRPMGLLFSDPTRLLGLAKSFVHPADVF